MPKLSIGRLKGRFCVTWYGDDGKRRRYRLKSDTRRTAEPEAVEVYRRETFKSRPLGANVAEIWALYIEDLGDKPTATTMGYTGKAILPHFGAWRPNDIRKDLCLAYSDARAAMGKRQGTIWTELGHLQSALNFAAKTGMLDNAPTIWRPEKPERDKRILNAGEARQLIDGASDPHVRLALIILLGTGARVGAVLDLTWERVDFDRNCINLRINDTATRKGRAIVPMNAGVRAALQTAHDAALTDYVIEYAGGPIKSIRKGVQGAIARSGIGHVTIHELRHTAAVHMLGAGVPIEKVAQVLGHSNVAITYRTYARYLPDQMQDAVDVLNFVGQPAVR